MVKFTLNSNISSSMGFAPFKLNYGFMPTLIGGITPMEKAKPGVKNFINLAIGNLKKAHDAIIESHVKQTHHTNCNPREETPFEVGDKVYLLTENLMLPKGRS
jgi:hypothetical protein